MDGFETRMKEIRKDFKINQKEMAKTINVHPSFISRLENGSAFPSPSTLRLICNTYNVSETWLMTGEGDKSGIANEIKEMTSDDLKKIIKDYTAIQQLGDEQIYLSSIFNSFFNMIEFPNEAGLNREKYYDTLNEIFSRIEMIMKTIILSTANPNVKMSKSTILDRMVDRLVETIKNSQES